MSDFKEAFAFTMKHEDPHLSGVVTVDAGGRTRFGIARKFHPDLPESFFDGPAEDALATAEQIEERDYWEPMQLSEIENQNIANKLFDMAVNMSIHQAGHLAQRAVNALIASGARATSPATPLVEDGCVGDKTIAAINSLDPLPLHQLLCEVSKQFYQHVVANNPAQAVNLHGWLKRAEA
ncbi:MAG TPA: glycosyl hydrolase 108 family protein [Verrucomicrobiae bacterium]|jgi:lysozyme family protein|nr:glycosyl hydrolase 108 family protein [Verrucomicrobiae bacterium]